MKERVSGRKTNAHFLFAPFQKCCFLGEPLSSLRYQAKEDGDERENYCGQNVHVVCRMCGGGIDNHRYRQPGKREETLRSSGSVDAVKDVGATRENRLWGLKQLPMA